MLFFKTSLTPESELQAAITNAYRMDETQCVLMLMDALKAAHFDGDVVAKLAVKLVEQVRDVESHPTGVEALMMHYDLSSEEGIMLMCLAEALLRIPDVQTEDLLIRDKLTSANWEKHIGASESAFVNMTTWGLALTGNILKNSQTGYFNKLWRSLIRRSGEPLIRQAVREAIKVMSQQFVIGRTIEEALKRSATLMKQGYFFSYDMLGEVARTEADAERYFQAYQTAIAAIAKHSSERDLIQGPSISVKLSALYPRYEFNQQEAAIPILTERLLTLTRQAKAANMSLTVDAEEADRLQMSLTIIKNVFTHPDFAGWEGLGLALQAYQKRAFWVLDWLIDLARSQQKRLQVRLVKGAYWDSEIKLTQIGGFEEYPVFTRKASTDISYLACSHKMLNAQDAIYSQFATHNAYSAAAIIHMLGDRLHDCAFEFQNLQGMGKALHNLLVDKKQFDLPTRVYAPVGSHEELLPYLVRRLLENGANSSFVHQITNPNIPIDQIVANPLAKVMQFKDLRNEHIPLPRDLFGSLRLNSRGLDLSHHNELSACFAAMEPLLTKQWHVQPFHGSKNAKIFEEKSAQKICSPTDHKDIVGYVQETRAEEIDLALTRASAAFISWSQQNVEARADLLGKVADLLEAHRFELYALVMREAGKVILDAVSEVREASDFCRYYASQARKTLASQTLLGYTGEINELQMRARGVIACISPWNFPIAIFTGQIAAALCAGNCVIAKPAEQTPLIAGRIIELFYAAGISEDVLQLCPGRGETVGTALVNDERVAGVIFTGSTQTAKLIQQALANRKGAIVPFIAETGGINALIADSTALPEQLVSDVLSSAFGSAGQRCSACRVLFIQDEVADKVLTMLAGAMAQIRVGNPLLLSTDVGPVIDQDAKNMLQSHIDAMQAQASLIYKVNCPSECDKGTFIAPHAFLLPDLSLLKKEVFGPVLHVICYARKDLDQIIDAINQLGYGLTFGIHSRVNAVVDYIQSRIHAGNIYVNRNMIGAVVGVQPFGGSRLSGTGPKAGGPHYLSRLCDETTLTINTAATGGNTTLMALED